MNFEFPQNRENERKIGVLNIMQQSNFEQLFQLQL